jgi:hypothetical protein
MVLIGGDSCANICGLRRAVRFAMGEPPSGGPLAAIMAAFQKVGALFRPLRDPDSLAAFIDLEAGLPRELPQHDERLHQGLQAAQVQYAGGPWAVGQLRERMLGWPRLQRLMERLSLSPRQPGESVVLVSPAEECASCGSTDLRVNDGAHLSRPACPAVFLQEGKRQGEIWYKTCRQCGAKHGLSFASGGSIREGHVRPIPGCMAAPYFQLHQTVYATRLLQRYTAQAVHSHTAFMTFSAEYFSLTGDHMPTKAFTSCYLVFAMLVMLVEADEAVPDLQVGEKPFVEGETPLDRTIRTKVPLLFRVFVTRWGKKHAAYCRLPGRCNCWIFDGHMKCKRNVCANKRARVIDLGPLGTAVLGCTHTPLRGSRFCFQCRPSAAHSQRLCQLAVEDEPMPPSQTVGSSSTGEGSSDIGGGDGERGDGERGDGERGDGERGDGERGDGERGDGERGDGEDVSPVEQEVYLVEKLLESRLAMRKNERETSRSRSIKSCMRSRHKEYLVKFVDYDEPEWVCQCDVGSAALEQGVEDSTSIPTVSQEVRAQDTNEWKGRHSGRFDNGPPSGRTRHAGKRAAELSGAASGDFKTSGADADVECQTLKENQYGPGQFKHTTAGILAMVSSCGLFLAADELIGAESLTQVHLFLYALFFIHGVKPPEVLAYDDACHLLRFWQLREARSKFVQWLLRFKKVLLVVDRFHFKFCKLWVDPSKCAKLGELTSTEAGEQSFSWLARSKHTLRGMNEGRFQFMTLHLMHERNKWLIAQPVRSH